MRTITVTFTSQRDQSDEDARQHVARLAHETTNVYDIDVADLTYVSSVEPEPTVTITQRELDELRAAADK